VGTNGHGPCRLTRQGHLIGITTEARDVPQGAGSLGLAGWLVTKVSPQNGGREVHPTTKTQMLGLYGL